MERCYFIIFFLLKLFLIGSSQIFYASFCCAQSSSVVKDSLPVSSASPASQPWQQLLLELSETEDFETTLWEDYEDDLEELAQHPMNLNVATREELEQLPFLTASQVEDIQAYVYRYGGMKSMAELALIPSISWYQRQLMDYFFYVADVTRQGFPGIKTIVRYGKHELMGMLKVPFYER